MYNDPPEFEMTCDELEEFALSRLKVLRKIEDLKTRNMAGEQFKKNLEKAITDHFTPSNHLLSCIQAEYQEKKGKLGGGNSMGIGTNNNNNQLSNKVMRMLKQQAQTKLDIASHFILRLAYCKTEELRRWFVTQECALFKYRFEKVASPTISSSSSTQQGILTFLQMNDLHYQEVSEEEKYRIKQFLVKIPVWNSTSSSTKSKGGDIKVPSDSEVDSAIYYKIPFYEASDLIANRSCYVYGGYAYVPLNKIVSIVTAKFRTNLSRSLAIASRVASQAMSTYAPQMAPLLNNMNSQYTGRDYNDQHSSVNDGDYELTSRTIDNYVASMPLCMSQLHAGLKRDSKLRHHGRLQYGLFLKGAGMSMEESLIFFQRIFSKLMTAEQFQKNYSYNIRHMYGKEGKRANYTPYNCTKIVLGNPPQTNGDHHGCPYKHYDDDNLSALLGKMNIGTPADRDAIMGLKRGNHFQLACAKHFEVTHPGAANMKDLSINGVGDHPNAWYAASVSYNAAKSSDSTKSSESD